MFSFVFGLTTSIGSDKEATRTRVEVKVEDGDERKGLIRIAELETTYLYTSLLLLPSHWSHSHSHSLCRICLCWFVEKNLHFIAVACSEALQGCFSSHNQIDWIIHWLLFFNVALLFFNVALPVGRWDGMGWMPCFFIIIIIINQIM